MNELVFKKSTTLPSSGATLQNDKEKYNITKLCNPKAKQRESLKNSQSSKNSATEKRD
jgi:hypothetical protein